MRFYPPTLFCLLFLLIMSSACTAPETNSNKIVNKSGNVNVNSDTTKDDVEDFAKIVKLPYQPEEVSWRESSDKKIIAVLKFSPADAQSLVAQIEKQKPAQNSVLNAENWFPPELIAKSQQAGDETLKGKEYSASDFFLAPYKNGKITQIDETNYFILELSAS